jgi:hypothetical protein
LDGGRIGIAEAVDPRLQARIQVELVETHLFLFFRSPGVLGGSSGAQTKQQQRLLN